MPCEKYESKKQRALCFATGEWKDWSKVRKLKESKIKNIDLRMNTQEIQTEAIKCKGGKKEYGI